MIRMYDDYGFSYGFTDFTDLRILNDVKIR
jgi:hypothetical protein